uniref:Protein CDV3 homolog n=1 Tax=Ascaris lumbricoides TaxID=6252 RepID=A0A0M3I636_ASCLU
MADDLSQFFAKKAAKSKDRKKKVKVSVDDVGQVLERKAKRQEERDRENEEEEKRAQEEAMFFEKRTEDSEWLEFKDTNKEMSLEELGIRDMNLTEQVEEALDEEKTTPTEAPKTWNTAATETKEVEEATVIAPPKPAIWRPRHQLAAQNAMRAGAAPNIADQEMFPTFADAEKIEKLKKDDEKKRRNDGFTTVTSERETPSAWGQRGGMAQSSSAWQRGGAPSSSNTDRAALFSAVKQVTSGGAPNPVPPPQPSLPKNPNAYVPPSRRRAEAMQMQ